VESAGPSNAFATLTSTNLRRVSDEPDEVRRSAAGCTPPKLRSASRCCQVCSDKGLAAKRRRGPKRLRGTVRKARVVDFSRYSQRHRGFHSEWLPPLLENVARPGVIADIGAGDGRNIGPLYTRGRLGKRTYAIDLSPERLRVAETTAPGVVGIVGDATALPLKPQSVDGAICSQVIEHVADSDALVAEIARILRPGGWWYIASVLRQNISWWIYRRDGRWWLDPTHVREYESEADFLGAIHHPLLRLEDRKTGRFRFPLTELALRTGIALRIVPARSYHLGRRGPWISPPGYRMIEAAGIRLDS
jgi:SAM-dependent methyltransferase